MCNFRKRISFCAWNINGINHKILGDKSSYSDFLNLITQHDLTILTETWSNFAPVVNGYNHFSINSQKHAKKAEDRPEVSQLSTETF